MNDAKVISSVITPENQSEWIGKAEVLTKKKLEEEVAKASPKAQRPEKAKIQGPDRIRVEFELSQEEMTLFRRAQDLVSQKLGQSANLAETQKLLLECFLDKHDPVRKAQRAKVRENKGEANKSQDEESKSHKSTITKIEKSQKRPSRDGRKVRAAVPAKVLHAVNLRDKGRCQAKLPDGSICGETRWLHHHHIIPVADGGQNTAKNLITLCSGHHRIWHTQRTS